MAAAEETSKAKAPAPEVLRRSQRERGVVPGLATCESWAKRAGRIAISADGSLREAYAAGYVGSLARLAAQCPKSRLSVPRLSAMAAKMAEQSQATHQVERRILGAMIERLRAELVRRGASSSHDVEIDATLDRIFGKGVRVIDHRDTLR